jgi:hypothetical protein
MLKPLNNIKNLTDPLKMFQATWAMSFQGNLATFIKNNTNAKIDASEVGKDLELRCQSYSFPKITGDKTEVNLGGFKRVYAGKQVREGEWSVQFVEVWDSSITDVFKAWFNSYHNYLNGKINLLSDYTATVTVKLVNPEESYDSTSIAAKKQSYDIILYDVFPLEITFPKIDASKSDPVTIDAKFHYNYFLMGDEIAASQQAPSDN